jgi:hypothetical protein
MLSSMAKKRIKCPRDPIASAHLIGQIATGQIADAEEDGKDAAAVSLGQRGGLKGGKASKLAKKRRKSIAEKAAKTRWNKDAD